MTMTGNADLPPLARAASDASVAAQQKYVRGTLGYLALLVAAAVFGAARYQVNGAGLDYAATAALVCFGVAAMFAGFLAATRPDRTWYDGRAAAESVKTLAWRYAVGGSPFPISTSGRPTDEVFVERLNGVIKALTYVTIGGGPAEPQITPWMRVCRLGTLVERRRLYEEGRIKDQQAWYSSRATWNEGRASLFAWTGLGLTVIGFLLALSRVIGFLDVDLLGIVSASAAALAAWLQVKQHDGLARAYSVAAQELGTIRSLIDSRETESDWALFVDSAEDAVSREHTMWLASRGLFRMR